MWCRLKRSIVLGIGKLKGSGSGVARVCVVFVVRVCAG